MGVKSLVLNTLAGTLGHHDQNADGAEVTIMRTRYLIKVCPVTVAQTLALSLIDTLYKSTWHVCEY